METGNLTTHLERAKELKVTDCRPKEKRARTCTDPDCYACIRREVDEADTGPGRADGG